MIAALSALPFLLTIVLIGMMLAAGIRHSGSKVIGALRGAPAPAPQPLVVRWESVSRRGLEARPAQPAWQPLRAAA